MTLVKKNFRCFRCNYLNKVTVPHYFKGKKCECCQSFNYFNYIPNYHKRNSNRNAFNIYQNKDNFSISKTILKKRLLILEIIFFIMSRTLILFLIEMRQQYILITTEIMILIIHLITSMKIKILIEE